MPSNFTAGSVADLIADINAANAAAGSNTITLAAGATFSLNAVDNSTDGPTGLPVIARGDNLTIFGNGDTIQRSTAKGTPSFRLFDVAAGASLTLQNLTLQRGLAVPSYSGSYVTVAQGGAIYNQGTLALSGVTVQNNTAQGLTRTSGAAAGGGIWSSGWLTVEHSIIQNNQALGANGVASCEPGSSGGGSAAGGGLYISGGSANLIDVTLYSNTARGGDGANRYKCGGGDWGTVVATPGGDSFGGALYAAGGTVSLLHTTVTHNSAKGGSGGSNGNAKASDGVGQGGGLYLAAAASVCLDVFTQANVKDNSPDDIFGLYTVC
ncbi:MAG: hypothetical protein HYS12_14585 [Planctomycetes bacterium]|nr:hypothetical protein [Planctomycetota bacterium]